MITEIHTLAQTLLLCANLYTARASDLGAQWASVCIEVAERASLTTVRPSLAVAVTWHESRMRRDVVGALGEVGAMQCNPHAHDCHDPIGVALAVLQDRVSRFGEYRGVCAYRGAQLNCSHPRVALTDRIDPGVGR